MQAQIQVTILLLQLLKQSRYSRTATDCRLWLDDHGFVLSLRSVQRRLTTLSDTLPEVVYVNRKSKPYGYKIKRDQCICR